MVIEYVRTYDIIKEKYVQWEKKREYKSEKNNHKGKKGIKKPFFFNLQIFYFFAIDKLMDVFLFLS